MSREATVVTLGARPPLALPEKPRQESRWEQRSEVAKTSRGMFRADPSEGERITHFGVDAEVQSDCGCLAGSFEEIAHGANIYRRGGRSGGHSEESLELLLRGGDLFFRLGLWNRREAEMRKSAGPEYEKRVFEPSLMK